MISQAYKRKMSKLTLLFPNVDSLIVDNQFERNIVAIFNEFSKCNSTYFLKMSSKFYYYYYFTLLN